MEFAWLEDFLALVDSGNFSRAAELRHVTQPAFSRRIRALEDWVGADLFERDSHPVTLTEAGHRFRPVVEELLRRCGKTQVRRNPCALNEILSRLAAHLGGEGAGRRYSLTRR